MTDLMGYVAVYRHILCEALRTEAVHSHQSTWCGYRSHGETSGRVMMETGIGIITILLGCVMPINGRSAGDLAHAVLSLDASILHPPKRRPHHEPQSEVIMTLPPLSLAAPFKTLQCTNKTSYYPSAIIYFPLLLTNPLLVSPFLHLLRQAGLYHLLVRVGKSSKLTQLR